MADLRWIRSRAAAHPQLADTAFGLLLVGVLLLAMRFGPADRYSRTIGTEDLLAGSVAVALIAVRRRWPLPAYAAVTVASAAFNLHDALVGPLLAANVISTYTVASRTDRRTAVLAGIVTVATVYVAVVLGAGRSWTDPLNATILAWGVVAAAVGDAVRARRAGHAAVVAAAEDRARQAEHGRAEEGRRLVVEERLRIARDLHDVVAHHIAVINVQVGVAAHLLRADPDGAEQALTHVRQAAREVLTEMSTVMEVLRTEPPPGLSRLTALLAALATAGLRVEHRQDGEARDLPAAVDLAAYRIVQESLTNAHKHGSDSAARLRLEYTPAGLGISVANACAAGPATGSGHGLIGLRERVSSVGGTVRTGRGDDGCFTVEAFLPAALLPAESA